MCKFCNSYNISKEIHNRYRINCEYKVAFVTYSWTSDQGRQRADRTTNCKDYDLNYCPECGRKLKED